MIFFLSVEMSEYSFINKTESKTSEYSFINKTEKNIFKNLRHY
jgi:hypothetical protein